MAHQLQPQPPLDLSDVDLSQIDVGALVLAHAQLQQQVATLRSAEEVNVLQADRARALEENAALQATIARLEQVRLAQEQSALRPRTSTSTDPRRRPAEPGQTQPSPRPSVQRASPADRERVHARQFPPTTTSSPPAHRSSSSGSQTSGLPPARATPRAAAGTRTAPPPVVPEARPSSAAASPHAASGTSSGSRAIPSRPSSARTAPAGVKKKQGQYQMTKKDFPKEAESCKNAFQLHIRFLWGYLDAIVAPPSAAESAVRDFQRRFRGKSVLQMRLQGKEGRNVIAPTQVKVGFDATEVVRSRNKIAGAFLQLEESGILHVRSYFAKLGIKAWAPDFTQTTYSLYNMGMRMSAIDTFRYLVAGTYYDFLKLDTRIVDDTSLLTRLYDHFVHHYMYEKWKAEIREPGGIQSTSERNKHSQARLRLNTSRRDFLKFMETSEGIKLMFPEKAKATSDDESTPTGVRARGRAERSQDADRLVRAVDALLIQNLRDDGKTQIAKSREKRVVPAFGQRSPSIFSEVPKGMPIQYYDPDWYNNRPPQARAKLQAKLVVVFVPGSSDFFSSRSDNVKLSVEELTQKYGEQVFSLYDTDFKELRAPTRAAAARLAAAGSDDDGESIGSQDTADGDDDEQLGSADEGFLTDDEMAADDEDYEEGSDAGGEPDDITEGAEGDFAEDVSGSEDSDDVESTQVGGYLDEDAPMEDAALDAQNRADFASAFDTGSRAMTLEEEIFGGPNDDSD